MSLNNVYIYLCRIVKDSAWSTNPTEQQYTLSHSRPDLNQSLISDDPTFSTDNSDTGLFTNIIRTIDRQTWLNLLRFHCG